MNLRLGPILALVLATSACSSDSPPAPTGSGSRAATIPQPEPPEDLAVAPDPERVDLAMPTFTNPTEITNPLFPVSSQRSVLLLGTVEDQAFRTEVTLLPTTRILQWEGQQIEALVSQYVAFLDGRIEEVAYDLYAQADDGSVWYFGEDVFNFADGVIADTHGTWIAGVDGPAAMIMPADPQVGDVYRPENIPGFVFEEVTVVSIDQTLDGPLGPIEGGLLVEELHMDGATEEKTFAPGYGEFYTAGGGDVEALALAVPTDAADGDVPAELGTMTGAALDALAAAIDEDWPASSAALDELATAWTAYQPAGVPRLVEPVLEEALQSLRLAIDEVDVEAAAHAAIGVARLALDLQLRHRPSVEIDLARFDLWLAEMEVDAATEDAALVNGDFFAVDYVRDRILHAIDPADLADVNLALEELLGAIGEEDYEAVAEIAAGLRETVAGLTLTP
jgi:hypothetical protein